MTTGHPISLAEPFALDTSHFVGYHDLCPWSPDNRRLLAHSATLEGGLPGPEDPARIVVVEAPPGGRRGAAAAGGDGGDEGHGGAAAVRTVATTRAWNWQVGARAQWLPGAGESLLIHNRRDGAGFGSAVVDAEGEVRRELPFPVYALDPAGELAAFVDFGRLHRLRPGYGYPPAGGEGPDAGPGRADGSGAGGEDGLHLGDLATGSAGLLLSHREILRELDAPGFEADRPCWIEHPTFSPSGGRLALLFRTRSADGGLPTRLAVTDPERSELICPDLAQVTHYAWLDEDRIVAWGRDPGSPAGLARRIGVPDLLLRAARAVTRRFAAGPVRDRVMGDRFRVVDLEAGRVETFAGGALERDGHPAARPGSEVVLCDSYPDGEGRQRLFLVDPGSGRRVELGGWRAPLGSGPDRCDLHPRWDRTGRRICVDSAHTGTRRVHVADVGPALEALEAGP